MKTIVRIFQMCKAWRKQLVIATISLFLMTALNLIPPALIRSLFKSIENGGDNLTTQVWVFSGIMLVAYILRLVFQYFNSFYAHVAAWKCVAMLRGKMYNHLQGLSMRYYSNKQTGQLMSRIIEDTANLEVLIAHALPDLISGALIFVGVLVIVFVINPVLGAITCIPIPLILLVSRMLKRIRARFKERQVISAELNGLLQDNLSGIKEIQVFNRQRHEYEQVNQKAQAHASKTLAGLIWVARLHPSMNFLTGLGTLLVVLMGGLMVVGAFPLGSMGLSPADITGYLLFLGLLYAPVATLSRVLEDVQTAVVSGERIFEILDTESEIKDKQNATELKDIEGNIEYKNVSFDYNEDVAVLKNVSFTAKAGEMVALVGATGAGKSTITALLARFYDSISGEISIDGTDIKDVTLESLRSNISMVLQDVFLFNGTIKQNISYSRCDDVTDEEIVSASKIANIHDFIVSLPEGYNTMIGERGVRLSGGQKQRLAIARAVIRKSKILILDEATSAVDNETETQIQNAIGNLMGTSTILVIAHRLSTVEKADQILVLDNGEIVERGTHAELLAKNGLYCRMHNK